jgi:excisionase family DNA binding protein
MQQASVRQHHQPSPVIGFPASREPQPLSLADRIARIDHALTAKEVAKLLNTSPITIYQHAQAGLIPSFKVGTLVRFDPAAVAKWLRTQ